MKRCRTAARTARVLDLLTNEGHARARAHDEQTYLALRLDQQLHRGDVLDVSDTEPTSEDDRDELLDR